MGTGVFGHVATLNATHVMSFSISQGDTFSGQVSSSLIDCTANRSITVFRATTTGTVSVATAGNNFSGDVVADARRCPAWQLLRGCRSSRREAIEPQAHL